MPANVATLWQPALDGELARSARETAHIVAARLRDPAAAAAAATAAVEQTAFPGVVRLRPHAVAQGYAGLAIMCGYADRCFAGQHWDQAAHAYLTLAARGAEAADHLPMGLWSGLSGLCFAADYLAKGGARYRRLLAALDGALLPNLNALAAELHDEQAGVPVDHFDCISGLSGIAAYLLCRREDARAAAALGAVLSALVDLSTTEHDVPCWHTPAAALGDASQIEIYPYGNLNCGLAHGAPGMLAALALSRLDDAAVPGLDAAVDRLAAWLIGNRCDDEWGINWPSAVALETCMTAKGSSVQPSAADRAPFGPSRAAWCYGSPGIARALWLAGEALDHGGYRNTAIAAMEAVFRRPLSVRWIDSPTCCHGVAGLLQITLRFWTDTGLPLFRDAARVLAEQLLALFEPSSRLGYRSLEISERRVDQPGVLDGAAGVALVLLAASTDHVPSWDRLFLLS